MDTQAQVRSERDDTGGAGDSQGKIFAKNTGICAEERYGPVQLNVGCGKVKWDGWTGVDFTNADVCCDIRELPYASNSVDALAAIHVIEHFYSWEVPQILAEWRRVLKPDGKLILELPSMNKILWYFKHLKSEKVLSMFWNALWGEQHEGRVEMCHKYGYSQEQMTKIVSDAGFRYVCSVEPHYHFPQRDMRIEAVK